MAENQESVTGIIENLALISDAMQTLFPEGRMICVYELNKDEYNNVQKNFREIDKNHSRFSIDMSGLEHVFINIDFVEPINTSEKPKEDVKVYQRIVKKLSSWFKRSVPPVK